MFRRLCASLITPLSLFVCAASASATVPLAPPVLIAEGLVLPRSSAVGDLNRNGALDVVTVEQAGERVVWFENRLREGEGWHPWTIDLDIEDPIAVVVGDLTGNGYPDVVVTAISVDGPAIVWYRNTGDPTAGPWERHVVATELFSTQAVAIADIDNDGRPDIVAAAAESGVGPFELRWYRNTLVDGETRINEDNSFVIDRDMPGIGSIAVGDISGNGRIDVAIAATFGSPSNPRRLVAWYANDGAPAAGEWFRTDVDDNLQGAARVALADLDNSGALDIVASSLASDVVRVYLNDSGDGSVWVAGQEFGPADGFDRPNSIVLTDLTQNGAPDLVVGTLGASGGDRVLWFENDGRANFEAAQVVVSAATEVQFHVAAGDLRGDGDNDLVLTRAFNSSVRLVENTTIHRNAQFNRPAIVVDEGIGICGDVITADINRDGQADLIAASPATGSVRWFANTGAGTIWTPTEITSGFAGISALASGDITLNGRTEVVGASPESGRIEVFVPLNAAGTSWDRAVVTSNYGRVTDVALVDVLGDGLLDIVAASPDASPGDIVWFANVDGSGGNWGAAQPILASQPGAPGQEVLRRIAVGDVSGNGLVDIVSGMTGIPGLSLYRHTVPGSFAPIVIDDNFALADRPFVADIDRDGALDVIAVGTVDGVPQLAWFRNAAGDGSSWTRQTLETGVGVFDLLAVADLRGNGVPDILARTPAPTLYQNDGEGLFAASGQPGVDLFGRVAVADFDNDGDLDVAGKRLNTGDETGQDIGWFENTGGQFGFVMKDLSPTALGDDEREPMLRIQPVHNGIAADPDIQITSLELRFEDESGLPYTSADVNSLLANLTLHLGDGADGYDPDEDPVIETVTPFTLVDGVLTIDFAVDDPNMRIAVGDETAYWIAVTTQPDASSAFALPRLRIVHVTESSSTAIDAESGLPLTMAFTPNEGTGVIPIIDRSVTPLIELINGSPLIWEAGDSPYVDPGAIVSDPNDPGPIMIGPDNPEVVDVNTLGTYEVVFNYENLGQEAPTVTRTVIVADTTPPAITLEGDDPLDILLTIELPVGDPYVDPGATAEDSFEGDISDRIVVTNPVNTTIPGIYTVRFNVSDSSGNTAPEVTRTVRLFDVLAPVITLVGGPEITVEAGEVFVDPGFTAIDDVDGDITDQVQVTGTVNTNVINVYTLNYLVDDSSGNTSTRTRNVQVIDTTPPVITLLGDDEITVEAGEAFVDPGATAEDSFEGDLTADIVVTGAVDTGMLGEYVLSYDVSDSSGNAAATVTRTVTVVDTTPPVITLVGDATISVPLGGTFDDPGATAEDSFEGDLTADIVVTGTVDTNTLGEYVLSYDVSDSSGNAATTVTRTVTVFDPTLPTIALLGDAAITTEAGEAYVDPGATAVDSDGNDISGDIVVTGTVDTNTLGEYTLSYDVVDGDGNAAATVTRTVTVVDTTPPVITLLGDAELTVEAGDAFTDPGATASDSFEGDLTAEIVVTGSVDTGALGEYVLSYDVSDSSGNAAATVTRTVTVVDTTPPVITLLGDAELTVELGDAFADPGATASDSFEGDLTNDIVVTGTVDIAAEGVYVLSYDVSDSSGNAAATVTRTVTVVRTFDPRDINRDGFINAIDVQLVINAALGIAIDPAFNADVNGDGAVNAVDVQLVINGALGL